MGTGKKHFTRMALFGALALSSVALTACDSAEDRLAKHLQSGQELVQSGEFEKAVVEFRNSLSIDADSVPAHLGMAEIYEKQRNYPAMVAHLNKVVEVDPQNAAALVKLGQIMMLSGQLDQALENANAAIAIAPENVEALVLKAGISLRLNNVDAALELAKQAIALDKDNATAHAVLIGERLKAQDLDGALAIADDITRRAPQDIGVALVKLQVLEQRKDNEAIGAYLKELVKSFPDQVSLRSALAQWHVRRNETAEAEEQLRAISEARPDDSDAAIRVAQFILRTRGKEDARKELERLISERPGKAPFQIALAQLDNDEGKTAEARAYLEGVIKEAVDAGDQATANQVRLALAKLLLREDARGEVSELVEVVLKDDSTNVDALMIRAALRYDEEDYTNALLDIRTALASAPDNPELLMLSARTHMRTGSMDIAGENMAAAMQASNFEPKIAMEYVGFLRRNGREDAVVTVLTEASRRHPGDKDLLSALAETQLRSGDWVGADATASALANVDGNLAKRVQAATLSGRERYEESIAVLNDLSKDPDQRDSAMAAMVQVYHRAGKVREAMDFLDGVLKENSGNAQALMLRATLFLDAKDVAAAENDYKTAIGADPKAAGPVLALARLYFSQDKGDEALKLLNDALGSVENAASIRFMLGGYYESRRDVDEAIRQYRALYAIQPDSAVAVNNLASLLAEYHADDPAILAEAGEMAEKLRGVPVPAFQDTYGWVKYKQGEYEEALRALLQAYEGLKDNPFVRYHTGMAYAALSDADAARPHLEAAAAADPAVFPLVAEAKDALAKLSASTQ